MKPVVLVLMGVAGSGKSSLGEALSERLGWVFQEGDLLHPEANREKMAAGFPLTDEDRAPWLEAVGEWAARTLADGHSGIITCSALKRRYRDQIRRLAPAVRFVHLALQPRLSLVRVGARKAHFMPASLVESQFSDLEAPGADERAILLDADRSVNELIEEVVLALGV